MSINRNLLPRGGDEIIVFTNCSYDTALIGLSLDNRAVYDFDLMVEWLISQGICIDEVSAKEWICYNTLDSLRSMGETAPIIIRRLG